MYNSDPDVYRKQLMKIEIELTSQLLELCTYKMTPHLTFSRLNDQIRVMI